MLKIDESLSAKNLTPSFEAFWKISGDKIRLVDDNWDSKNGSPVFTVKGKYTSQGWTEWTQGFQFGSSLLQFDATGDESFLQAGRRNTLQYMAPHVTHFGVHDHGFNNVSTYGALLRLLKEGRIPQDAGERNFYEMAMKASASVQAYRWTSLPEGEGYIHSFNGAHSLFADTIRSLRALSLGHSLGHYSMEEKDTKVSLLQRLIQHARATATYSVYYGEGRDNYDMRGRVAHESVFNTKNGNYRCPNSQQGFSPFTTWTRGLAWIICGYPELLEWIDTVPDANWDSSFSRDETIEMMLKAATASCDFYLAEMPTDGIPYWDTGAPNLHRLGDYQNKPAEPYNDYEPVDSSAAAISCQGLIRLGRYLQAKGKDGRKYEQAGLTVLKRLLEEPYLSQDANHQGLLLHSIYHQPNGWDYVPEGSRIANGEACMWGDYHLREAVLYAMSLDNPTRPYYTFFGSAEAKA